MAVLASFPTCSNLLIEATHVDASLASSMHRAFLQQYSGFGNDGCLTMAQRVYLP